MKALFSITGILFLGVLSFGVWYALADRKLHYSDTEAGFEESAPPLVPEMPQEGMFVPASIVVETAYEPPVDLPLGPGRYQGWSQYWREFSPFEEALYGNWKRPPGPTRVGVQVGHWQLDDVPEELEGLRVSTGARGGGYTELEIVLEIAQQVKVLLEEVGVVVDLLPATIPVDYYADAFVSIHADGNDSPSVSGFKISGPRRDFSGGAETLVEALYESYDAATGLRRDANVTRRMSSYYAFNWRRYDHALHPMTPAAIVETGFVTSPTDRAVIVSESERAAQGIAEGILDFLGLS